MVRMVADSKSHRSQDGPFYSWTRTSARLVDLFRREPRGRLEDPSEPRSADAPTRADRLLESGLFDMEFYSSASGLQFSTERNAVRHCLNVGMGMGLSPHPLLDLESMPRRLRNAWQRGQIRQILAYLRSDIGVSRSTGPLFYPPALNVARDALQSHPGGPLGAFLADAHESTPLPVPPGYWGDLPTWGAARRMLLEHAKLVAGQSPPPPLPRSSDALEEASALADEARRAPRDDRTAVTVLMTPPASPRLLIHSLDMLRAQSLGEWQLIVATPPQLTPDLRRVLEAAAAKDSRIYLREVCVGHRRDEPGVKCSVLAVAKGRHIAFLEPGTDWDRDYLRTMSWAMRARGLNAAQGWFSSRDADDPTLRRLGETHTDLLHADTVWLSALMATRKLLVSHSDLHLCDVATEPARALDLMLEVAHTTPWINLPVFVRRTTPTSSGEDSSHGTSTPRGIPGVLQKHLMSCPGSNRACEERDRERVSVVVPTREDFRMTIQAVSGVLRYADSQDVEVVVVDNGSRPRVGERIRAAFLTEPRVRYLRLARNFNFATGCNYGFAFSTGERVVFLNNDTIPRPGWLSHLLPALDDATVRGAQPLLLYPDDTIQTAGTYFPAAGSLPCHFLVGHPPEDAGKAHQRRFTAVTAAAMAVRAIEFEAVGGFDPIYVNGMEDVDLCLRMSAHFGGDFCVVPSSRVTHLEGKTPGRGSHILSNRATFMDRWRHRLPQPDIERLNDLGFTLAHVGSDEVAIPSPRPVLTRIGTRPPVSPVRPRLRWGIKLPSTAGPSGDAWGDTHLAHSLVDALRELGHDAVTYRRGSHQSPASYLDDVVLGVRGLERIYPQAGKVNVLWVISHPDDVSLEELRSFDIVFAASPSWSRRMTELSGRPVQVLRQAVDARKLPAPGTPRGDGSMPVFIGGRYGDRRRQVVLDALAAGLDFAVHGPGWEGLVPAPVLRSTYVPNDKVTGIYRSHGLVLADHWADMARGGFIANRIYEAVAAGARVVSDDVPGIEQDFDGAVQVYRSVDELGLLCSREGRSRFPDDDALGEIAMRVRREESFLSRAQVLVEAVTGFTG